MQHIELNEKYHFSLGDTELVYTPNKRDKENFLAFIYSLDPKENNKKVFIKFFYAILKKQNPTLIRVEHGDIFGLFHFFTSIFLKSDV